MNSLKFNSWLQERDGVLNEFTLRFGKFKNQDHTAATPNWLDWAVREIPVSSQLSADEKKEITKYLSDIKYRGKEGDYIAGRYIKHPVTQPSDIPAPAQKAPSITVTPKSAPQPEEQEWTLAVAGENTDQLNVGQKIAVYKQHDGNWLYTTLEEPFSKGVVQKGNIAKSIKLIPGPDGRQVTAKSLDQLKTLAEKLGGERSGDWRWAKSRAVHEEGITPGEDLALSRRKDGKWSFVSLDERHIEGVLTNDEVAKIVTSVKDSDGKPVTFANLQDLKNIVAESNKNPNPYQDKIAEDFANTDKNIVINALAGTGKTTTLKRLAREFKKPGEKWLYLVFNKKNQTEAKGSFGKLGVVVKTSHSFLGEVLDNNATMGIIPDSKLPPKNEESGKSRNKIGEMIDTDKFMTQAHNAGIPNWPEGLMWAFKSRVKKLATMAKHNAVHPNEENSVLHQLISKYNIDTTLLSKEQLKHAKNPKRYDNEIVDMAKMILHQSLPGEADDPSHKIMRDHDDTLWWSALHAEDLVWPKFDVVLADEIQDFNKNQLMMLKKLSDQGARIVAVGDPNQAIYRFRGADSESFKNTENLLNNLPNGSITQDLPVNYRSGKNIINFANQNTLVNNLQAGKSHEGVVTTDKKYDDVMDKISNEWDKNGKLKHQTAFIARTNEPLVKTALQLLKNNINFTIIGKDFSDELVKLIDEVTKHFYKNKNAIIPIQDFKTDMAEYLRQKKLAWKGKESRGDDLKELEQVYDALDSVMQYLASTDWKEQKTGVTVRTQKELISLLKRLFSGLSIEDNEKDIEKFDKLDPKKSVILTTAHRSKGLEFDRVYLRCIDQFPHPSAQNAEERQQEEHAKYVAMTRATHQLHVLDEDCSKKN